MRGLSVSLAFAVVLVVCLMLVDGKDVCDYWGVESACKYDGRYKRPDRCTGLGRRYCDRAPEAKVCPEACNEKNCKQQDREDTEFRFSDNQNTFAWEDLVLASNYDMVFADPKGKEVCVQTCWHHPYALKCKEDREYDGIKYCKDIRCDHDKENRFAGCHKDRPWHKPTCKECAKLFPDACADDLDKYYDDKDDLERPHKDYLALQNREDQSSEDASDEKRSDTGESSVVNKEDSSEGDRNCDSSDGGENCRAGANAAPLFDPSDLEADDAYSFDIIPIMYEDNGTSYMSFNEIQFQLMGDEAEVQRDIISAAVAGIIGVSPKQVQTVEVVTEPTFVHESSNATDAEHADAEITDDILTVTCVVWTNDPYSLDKKIVNMMNDNSITDLMISHGLDTYLEVSMTSNVIAAPVAALEQIFPDASLYADQPKPFERNPMGGIIAIAVCSVLLLLGVAAIVALFVANKKKARREAEAARTDAKLGGVEEAISATASAEDGIPVPPTSVIEPEESMPAHRPNN